MNHGIYTALSGSLANERRLDIMTNNLANLNTTGFKREMPVFSSVLAQQNVRFSEPGFSRDKMEYVNATFNQDNQVDFKPGALQPTGNKLDVAIEGDAFFVVRSPRDGNDYYTRAGGFGLNSSKEMIAADGNVLLNTDGVGQPLVIDGTDAKNGIDIKINEQGVVVVNGTTVGTIRLVRFADPQALRKVGAGNFQASQASGTPQIVDDVVLRQGVKELSNVDPLSSMVGLIEISRQYELQQKIITSLGDVNHLAASEIAAL
ncbi:MAG: flagellar hook basal-body protein [Pseudomonadota bacterium]|nr:flagellar hook basal-body protein [Pseudomonadota bacterium]MEA3240582.1 flagellar hook basal-body protein [Pseudomonadota bacterium]